MRTQQATVNVPNKAMYNHVTTIEIDEEYISVSIDFENRFGEIIVHQITDLETGFSIDIPLSDDDYRDMSEMAADLAADARERYAEMDGRRWI